MFSMKNEKKENELYEMTNEEIKVFQPEYFIKISIHLFFPL